MPKKKDGYDLFRYWAAKAKEVGSNYKGNIHRDSAQLLRVAEHIGIDRTKTLISYYFKIRKEKVELIWFLYHYDELDEELERIERDRVEVENIRKRTRRIMSEQGGE